MTDENKKLLKYLGIIFLSVLLMYKLPYKPYSIMEYLLPPIEVGDNSRIYLSGFLSLVLFIVAFKGLFKLERFKYKSKFLVFLGLVVVVLPFMNYMLDAARTNYHWLRDDGLKSIDLEESDLTLTSSHLGTKLDVSLDLKDYGKGKNNFKIRVFPPEDMLEYTGRKYYELENEYTTYGDRNIEHIEETIFVKDKNRQAGKEDFVSMWSGYGIEYELYNDKEKVRLIQPEN